MLYTMKYCTPIVLLICLASMPACGPSITLGGDGYSGGGATENRTSALEGEWTLDITDSTGEYENVIEFSDAGEILHWYDQYGNDFYGDLSVGYSDVSVSPTNLVLLDLQYEYMLNDVLYSAEMSLSGLMLSDDSIMQLDGETLLHENGVIVNSESLDVYALRGDSAGGDGPNDGLYTNILEGTWYFTMTDLVETGIHSIEFDETGKMLHWVTPYGTDIARLDPESDLQAYVSSSYAVHLAGQYTFEHEGSTFSVSLELSGDMSQGTESIMSLDGIAKVYSNGYLVSLLHTVAVANRSALSGVNDNAKFASLEGEWVFIINDALGITQNNVICDATGDVTHWYLGDGQDIFSLYSEVDAMASISSSNQADAEMSYETTDAWGDFISVSIASDDGVFNEANGDFMQMVGERYYLTSQGALSYPSFISAFRASLLTTSVNDDVWPAKAIAAQFTGMGYGPLYSPWSRN